MNRIEFMLELAALLQDVPVEERTEQCSIIMIILMRQEKKMNKK